MTFTRGYALEPEEALENLDLGGGSRLSLKVTGQQSLGSVTVLEGVVYAGGPPLHVHDATPSGIEDFFRGQRDYLAALPSGTPPDPLGFAAVPGAEQRRVVGPPLARDA